MRAFSNFAIAMLCSFPASADVPLPGYQGVRSCENRPDCVMHDLAHAYQFLLSAAWFADGCAEIYPVYASRVDALEEQMLDFIVVSFGGDMATSMIGLDYIENRIGLSSSECDPNNTLAHTSYAITVLRQLLDDVPIAWDVPEYRVTDPGVFNPICAVHDCAEITDTGSPWYLWR